MAHPGGRPPKLDGHKIEQAAAYVDGITEDQMAIATRYIQAFVDKDTADTKDQTDDHMPTIEGLALELNVSRDSIYRWADTNEAFLAVITRLLNKQAHQLINRGLIKKYDSGLVRLMLSKHGYVLKTETDNTILFDKDDSAKDYVDEG